MKRTNLKPWICILGGSCLASIALQFIQLSRLVPLEYQIWDHPIVNQGRSNETFGACLLVFDDNHFLTEWLAFHYQTLPLRRLIVATDPRSRTRPVDILDRWKPYMNITLWSDTDYFPLSYRRSIVQSKQYPNITDKLVLMHRYRQRFFYQRCMQHFMRRHGEAERRNTAVHHNQPNLVAFLDVDEFLFPNRNWKFNFLLPPRISAMNISVADLLHRLSNYPAFWGPCIGLPRLMIGTKIDRNNQWEGEAFRDLSLPQQKLLNETRQFASSISGSLLTTAWSWHGQLLDHARNKAGKALLDLSRLSPQELFSLDSIDVHRPHENHCTLDHMWIHNKDSPLVVHHYVGTQEQFTFRSDPRSGKRTVASYEKYQAINTSRLQPWDQYQWLISFLQSMGVKKAMELLEGVGQVEKDHSLPLKIEESYQQLLNTIFPAVSRGDATY